MLINPKSFMYIKHWGYEDRLKASKIAFKRAERYGTWLGMNEATSDTLIGVFKAYRKYGSNLKPIGITGHVRTELRSSSRNKQHFVNVSEIEENYKKSFSYDNEQEYLKPKKGSYISGIDTTDDPRNSTNHIDLLIDIERILTHIEYDIVVRRILLDQKISKPDEYIYRIALRKMRELLYV
ncbi:MAG: hypothetical protein WCW84_06565 [Sulfurimonas sp.]|jgi:hypothetical protein